MGSEAAVLVRGGAPDVLERAEARVRELAGRWTRFEPTSELAAINAAPGRPVSVSSETLAVVSLALDAWRQTDGWFDPTVLPMLVAAGYDRSFERIAGRPTWYTGSTHASPGCAGVVCDPVRSTITVPPGVALDLGGIGKGHAADLLVAELLAGGAEGACADLGGDVAVGGDAGPDGAWVIEIEDPFSGTGAVRLALAAGAVATSSRLERRWNTATGSAHHLIDPRTGLPAEGRLATVTVVAASAAWAEVLAKAVLVSGDESLPIRFGCVGLAFTLDGAQHAIGALGDWTL